MAVTHSAASSVAAEDALAGTSAAATFRCGGGLPEDVDAAGAVRRAGAAGAAVVGFFLLPAFLSLSASSFCLFAAIFAAVASLVDGCAAAAAPVAAPGLAVGATRPTTRRETGLELGAAAPLRRAGETLIQRSADLRTTQSRFSQLLRLE
jgi:hypothetical protein